MAIEIGECGSTKEVRAMLAYSGINFGSLTACEGFEADLTARLERLASDAQGLLQEKLTEMEAALAERRERTARTAMKARGRVKARRAAAKEAASNALRASLLGGIRLQLTSYGHSIVGELDNIVSGQFEQVSRLSQASEQRRIERLRRSPDSWLEAERSRAVQTLSALREALDGPMFRGAVGEEMVAHRLRDLDDQYHVIHDVQIRCQPPVWLFERQVHAVQIDHLVVGPPGVFVVETKNWSRSSANRKGVRDPYEQTATNAHVVRRELRRAGMDVPVTAVLVGCSRLPEPNPEAWVVVARPDTLVGLISPGEVRLSADDTDEVIRLFVDELGALAWEPITSFMK